MATPASLAGIDRIRYQAEPGCWQVVRNSEPRCRSVPRCCYARWWFSEGTRENLPGWPRINYLY